MSGTLSHTARPNRRKGGDQGQAGQVAAALAAIPTSELEAVGRGTSNVDLKRIDAAPLTMARLEGGVGEARPRTVGSV
jgi:hypothetical protein